MVAPRVNERRQVAGTSDTPDSVRRRRAARHLPRGLALFRIFAAPVIAERDRPGADAVLAPSRRKTPAEAYRLVGVLVGAFGWVIVPPAAAGADEFGGHHPHPFRYSTRMQPLAPLKSPEQGPLLRQRARRRLTVLAPARLLPEVARLSTLTISREIPVMFNMAFGSGAASSSASEAVMRNGRYIGNEYSVVHPSWRKGRVVLGA